MRLHLTARIAFATAAFFAATLAGAVAPAYGQAMVGVPATPSSGYSSVWIRYTNTDTGASYSRLYKASTARTKFRVYRSYDAGHTIKVVSFTAFKRYVQNGRGSTLMQLHWYWKRIAGHRRRYIYSITVSNYDG